MTMLTISIGLSKEEHEALAEVARVSDISPEELAKAFVLASIQQVQEPLRALQRIIREEQNASFPGSSTE
jgi:hypothetical protein